MSDSQITKKALAEAMKELMDERPMKKISIGDIVSRCNLNRQSFYYHFKDKYDLVNWIYYTEFVVNIKDKLSMSSWEFLENMCQFFYDNKSFYTNAFNVAGQNSFSEYFIDIIHPMLVHYLKNIFDSNIDFSATFFADAIRVSITRWLLEGAAIPPNEFIGLVKTALTGAAVKLIEELN